MKSIIKSILGKLGYTLVSNEMLHSMRKRSASKGQMGKSDLLGNIFAILKKSGFQPKHIMDIGANHGHWSREVYQHFGNANFTLIEPQRQLSKSFSDLLAINQFEYLPIGVGEEKGSFKFTLVDRDDSANFRMTEEEAKQLGYEQVLVEVDTVDNIVAKSKFGKPDLLKIDAEGLDLRVLKGAKSILGKTEVILLEAAVTCPGFENDIASVIDFMNQNGYVLFDITDLNRPFEPRVLWLVELMFIKRNGFIHTTKWI